MKTVVVKFFSPLADIYTLAVLAQSAVVLSFVEQYVFKDWKYLVFLLILIGVDTAFGFYRAWRDKRVESRAWGKVIEKLFLYAGLLVTFHVLLHFTVNGEAPGWFGAIEKAVYSYIIIREAISVVEHVSILRPGLFPLWILDRLAKYKESGKFGDLIK